MIIRALTVADNSAIITIARLLPQWFTPTGVLSLQKDLDNHSGLVALENDVMFGFLIFFTEQSAATISWMGTHPNFHRKNIGTKLLEKLRDSLKEQNITEVFVSTLGDSVVYEPYDRTRAFYRKFGFVDHRRIHHPNNPAQEEELILRLQT